MNHIFFGDFPTLKPRISAAATWVSDETDAQKALAGSDRSVLFISDELLQADPGKLTRIESQFPKIETAVLYKASAPEQWMTWLQEHPTLKHLIPLDCEHATRFIERLPDLPKENWADRQEFQLTNSGTCDSVYKSLVNYVSTLSCFSGFEAVVQTSASELLTNAFYNGKKDPSGNAKVSDRRIKFELDPPEKIKFVFGRTEHYLYLEVVDPFGTLNRTKLVAALFRAATEKTAKMSELGGAGLGLLMLCDWATEVQFHLSPGKQTVVTAKFKLTPRNRLFDAEKTSVHICEHAS